MMLRRRPPRGRWLAPGLIIVAAAAAAGAGSSARLVAPCDNALSASTAAASDADAVEKLRAMSLDYVHGHQEPGRATITDSNGKRGTRANLLAALTLAEDGDYDQAAAILPEVIGAQETNPRSPLYGYFPEVIGQRPKPEDQIWMLFNGTFLLVMLDRDGAHFPSALRQRMQASAVRAATAAAAIPPLVGNTGQALLHAFVVLRAGEVSNDPKLEAAGTRLWNAFYRFTLRSGFSESGSPNYTKVHLYTLGFLADELRDSRIRAQAAYVRRLVWWSVTSHYHAATRQLAGPFIRTFTDRMAYELSGVQFQLFRESGERIALPPPESAAITWPAKNAEQPLHAVLSTLSRPSWPRAWIERALGPRKDSQIRERTISWPQPARPTGQGFSQLTTYMTPCTTLGSRNRDPAGMNDETRDIVAYAAAADGDVGVFRLRIDEPGGPPGRHMSRLVAVQQKSSVAAVVIGDVYRPSGMPMSFTLEWRGTALHPPSVTGPVDFGKTIAVDWMGARMRVRLTDLERGSSVQLVHPDRETVRLVWRGVLPRQKAAAGYNATPVIVLALGLQLQDVLGDGSVRSGALRPVQVTRQTGDWYRLSWASPDGALRSQFDNAINAVSVHEWVNGRPVAAVPIRASLPG